QRAHLRPIGGQFDEVDGPGLTARVVEQYLAAGDRAVARQNTEDRLADGRLARAGLADQRHGRGTAHAKRQILDCIDMPARRREADRKVLDLQQLAHCRDALLSGTRMPSALRLAAVASLNCSPRSAAAAVAKRTSRSKPSRRLSSEMRARPAPSCSCIQPL